MIQDVSQPEIQELANLMVAHMEQRQWEDQSGIKPDVHSIKAVIRHHMIDGNGVAYIHKTEGVIDGFFLGCVMPLLIDIRHMAAHEKMSGGEGIEDMWEKFIKWAKKNNAITAVRGCYDKLGTPRFRRI